MQLNWRDSLIEPPLRNTKVLVYCKHRCPHTFFTTSLKDKESALAWSRMYPVWLPLEEFNLPAENYLVDDRECSEDFIASQGISAK